MGDAPRPKPEPLLFETYGDDPEALRAAFADGFAMIAEPCTVAFLLQRPEFIEVYALAPIADHLSARANADRWLALFGRNHVRRAFLIGEEAILQQAQEMWRWETQPVAYDVGFVVEAIADNGAPGGGEPGGPPTQNRHIAMEGLFEPSELPRDTRQHRISDNTFELIIRRPVGHDPVTIADQVRAEVTAWFSAYTYLTGVGLRARGGLGANPVLRRLSGWRVGAATRTAPLWHTEEIRRVADLIAKGDRTAREAVEGLNESLCAPTPMARLMTLWRTVEHVLPRSGPPLVLPEERKKLKHALRSALPRAKADEVYSSACRLHALSPRQAIVNAIMPFAGELDRASVEQVVERDWTLRAKAAHSLSDETGIGPSIAFLEGVLARFIAKTCRVTYEGQLVVPKAWLGLDERQRRAPNYLTVRSSHAGYQLPAPTDDC